jgi:hypothetical protein
MFQRLRASAVWKGSARGELDVRSGVLCCCAPAGGMLCPVVASLLLSLWVPVYPLTRTRTYTHSTVSTHVSIFTVQDPHGVGHLQLLAHKPA